jgi:hypothetical protein
MRVIPSATKGPTDDAQFFVFSRLVVCFILCDIVQYTLYSVGT